MKKYPRPKRTHIYEKKAERKTSFDFMRASFEYKGSKTI